MEYTIASLVYLICTAHSTHIIQCSYYDNQNRYDLHVKQETSYKIKEANVIYKMASCLNISIKECIMICARMICSLNMAGVWVYFELEKSCTYMYKYEATLDIILKKITINIIRHYRETYQQHVLNNKYISLHVSHLI